MARNLSSSAITLRTPIIVIREKKAGHGGHHGGAWKVAYADFVTAMMALFIVLWLMSADEKVKEAVSALLQQSDGTGKQIGHGRRRCGQCDRPCPRTTWPSCGRRWSRRSRPCPISSNLKDHVEITITADGLRIELLETEAGMFFESGRPLPSENGAELLTRLAEELGKLPNNCCIEGHTDAKPFSTKDGYYSNWELSTDRANSARKLMETAWPPARAGGAGAGLCRPPVAPSGGSDACLESAHLGDRAVSDASGRTSQASRRGGQG